MKFSALHSAVIAALLAASQIGHAGAQASDPVTIVREIYSAYQADKPANAPYSPAVQNRLKRIPKEADELVDAQDHEVKNVVVKEVSRRPDAVAVDAVFTNFGDKRHMRFDFRLVDGKWMVANLKWLHGDARFDMRKQLKLPPLN